MVKLFRIVFNPKQLIISQQLLIQYDDTCIVKHRSYVGFNEGVKVIYPKPI